MTRLSPARIEELKALAEARDLSEGQSRAFYSAAKSAIPDLLTDLAEANARAERAEAHVLLLQSSPLSELWQGALQSARAEERERCAQLAANHDIERPQGAEWGLMDDAERSGFYANHRGARNSGTSIAALILALPDRTIEPNAQEGE